MIAISTVINNYPVERILVDDGSAIEVLIWDAFQKMGMDRSFLRSVGPIYEFVN